jgi:hypothetical protein
MLWQIAAVFTVHFVADFILQTHWQASNKSKNLEALFRHVGVYSLVLWLVSMLVFLNHSFLLVSTFVFMNGMLHLVTDYVTSRWSSAWFVAALRYTHHNDTYWAGWAWHRFFEVIGFDQWLHHMAFFLLLGVILGFR